MPIEVEVVVVGGGPIGLATALELDERGLEVLVVDRGTPPIDKACGEGLMPDGADALRRMGIRVDASGFVPIRGIRYLDGELEAEARFSGVSGMGIRRPVLHRAMVDRLEERGIDAHWEVLVEGLDDNGLVTDQGKVRCKWIVGADGLHSRVRKWSGLEGRPPRFLRHGVRRHYAVEPWTDLVEVYWADGCEAYVTPVSAGEVGVAILWSQEKAAFDPLLGKFPSLQERLRGVSTSSADRGAARLEQHTRGFYREGVALVGDAAGYRDAITGEGLSLGFHQAQALAVSMADDDLAGYERQARRLTRLPFLLIRLLLEAERRPRLRQRLIRTLATEPGLFARFLAIHTREASPRTVWPGGLLRLARGLLS